MTLNDYSARFQAVLLEAFPEFGKALSAGPDPGCFTVGFDAPSGSPFWVRTEEEERVTVGFDALHLHFGGWAGSVDEQDFAQAVGFIRELMAGEWVIAVWSRGGRCAGSSAVRRGEESRRSWAPEGDGVLSFKRWS